MPVYEKLIRAFWWLPNALSLFRGILVAPMIAIIYLWEFLNDHVMKAVIDPNILGNYHVWTFWLIAAAAATDGIDGYLARKLERFGWKTAKGGEIDAYCDKFLGIAILYIALPLHYWKGWYLVLYFPAIVYIAQYSLWTTAMRHEGKILKAGRIAKWKTAILMVVKAVAFFGIAYDDTNVILWLCTVATVVAAILCRFAKAQYLEMASESTPAE
jgi:phosphatidylglycerophosphate synthase